MFRVNDSNLATLACIIGVVALVVGAVGIATPAPGTFTKAVADTLYCKVIGSNCGQLGTNEYCDTSGVVFQTTNFNCSDEYCITSIGQGFAVPCSAIVPSFTYFTFMGDTKTTFSSSTFTTYGSTSCCVPQAYTLGNQVFCRADVQYQLSNVLAILDVRIKDTAAGGVTGVAWRVDPGVASANETLSYFPSNQFGNAGAQPIYALQFSVTGTGTATVYHGSVLCTDDTLSPGYPVG